MLFRSEKEGYSAVISIGSILEEHLMSPPSLPEVQEHSSSTAMSPASSTSEVLIKATLWQKLIHKEEACVPLVPPSTYKFNQVPLAVIARGGVRLALGPGPALELQ